MPELQVSHQNSICSPSCDTQCLSDIFDYNIWRWICQQLKCNEVGNFRVAYLLMGKGCEWYWLHICHHFQLYSQNMSPRKRNLKPRGRNFRAAMGNYESVTEWGTVIGKVVMHIDISCSCQHSQQKPTRSPNWSFAKYNTKIKLKRFIQLA